MWARAAALDVGAASGIGQQHGERGAERGGIVGEETGDAVPDDVGVAAGRQGDSREPHAARFEQGARQRLLPARGEEEGGGAAHQFQHLAVRALPQKLGTHAAPGALGPHLGRERAVAGDHQPGTGHRRHRRREKVRALVLLQLADVEDEIAVARHLRLRDLGIPQEVGQHGRDPGRECPRAARRRRSG